MAGFISLALAATVFGYLLFAYYRLVLGWEVDSAIQMAMMTALLGLAFGLLVGWDRISRRI